MKTKKNAVTSLIKFKWFFLIGLVAILTTSIHLLNSTSAQANNALQFDGSNDYVTFGNPAALGLSTFTVETWFMRQGTGVAVATSGSTSAVPLVAKGRGEADSDNRDLNYFLGIDPATNVLFADFEEGASGTSPGLNHPISGRTTICNDVWYHAAATYDGTKWQLFLNGELESELTVNEPPRSDSIQGASLATALNSSGVAAGFFNGSLDEVRVWNFARTGLQIKNNLGLEITSDTGLVGRWGLNEGAGASTADSSGSGVTGTLTNGPTWVTGSPRTLTTIANGLDLGGSTYVDFDAAPGLNATNFTLEGWIKREAAGTTASTGTGGVVAVPLITKGRGEADNSNLDMNYFLGIDASDRLVADFEDNVSGGNHPITGVTPLVLNTWYHVAATYDGSDWNLYVNGTLDATLPVGLTPRNDSIQHSAIGSALTSTGASAGSFDGVIDEIRIWNVARTENEISTNSNLEISSAAGLIGRWGFNQFCGNTVIGTAGTTPIDGTINGANSTWVAGSPFNVVNTTTVMFQDGANGYTGTKDTYIYDVSPTTARGSETTMVQDKNASDDRLSLLSFDLSSIPANATIVSASLDFYVDAEGQGFDMHRMLVPWDEATVTYASIGNRHFLTDNNDAESTVNTNWAGNDGYLGPITVSVPASTIQDWYDGTLSNNGWLMIATHPSDGQQLRSREHATVGDRPKLSVAYTTSGGNNAPDAPTLNSPADAATGVNTTPTLDVNVTDSDTDPLTVTFYGRPFASGNFAQIAQNAGVTSGTDSTTNWTNLGDGQTFEWYVTVSDGVATTTGPTWTFKTAPGASPAFVGVGDIASCATTDDNLTGNVITGVDGVIFTTGDNVYPNGTAADFANCYDPTPWGSASVKSRTRPVPGNHDWGTGVTNNLNGYNGYFGANATDSGGNSYYSYDLDSFWHVVNLDSECLLVPGGCGAGSPQEVWLRADLAANSTKNVIALWHKPRYSSGNTNYQAVQPLWDALYENGVDILLNGHDHIYERFMPIKSGATLADPPVSDPTYGIQQFTVGLGGEAFHTLGTPLATSVVQNNDTFGIFKLTLHPTSYDWNYLPVDGGTFTDLGSGVVHGSPPASTTSVDLQDGANGYSGTRDTYTYDVSPTTVRGGETTMVQDKNASDDRLSMLSFDLSSIPANATIVSADLEFYVNTEGQGFDMYRMKVPWNEATVTYSSIGNRHFAADDVDAESTVNANWAGNDGYVGPITVSVPAATIKEWVDGTMTNNGWLMIATDVDDGQQLRTREHPTVANRPKLSITYGTPQPGGNALDFGGTNAYVDFGNPAKLHLSQFTIETRFRRDGNGSTTTTGGGGIANAVPLVTRGRGQAENANDDTNFFLGINDTTDVLAADFEEGAGGTNPSQNHPILGTTVITNNEWHHAAATYDGTKWQLFLDGVLESELVVNEPVAAAGNQFAAIASALQTNGLNPQGFFDGVMDEVRIWDTALSQTQIRTNANMEISSAANLVARWGLNEGTGTSIGDSTASPANGTIANANWSWIGGSPVINLAPVVDAGADQAVTLPNDATLAGSISDDGLPNPPNSTTALWTQFSGPGTATFNDNTSLTTTVSFSASGTYVLRLTGNDSGKSRSDDVTVTVTGNTVVKTFQEGNNGYSGTIDTYLRETQPTTSQGNLPEVEWDLQEGASGVQHGLVRFENLFGAGTGQIPSGVFITSATLSYTVFDTGDPADVNEVVAGVPWDQTTTTFNNFGGEPDVQNDEYGNSVGSASGSANGVQTVDVTSSIQDWYTGTSTNNGWIFRPTGGGGVGFRSSEFGTIGDRPSLSITYSTVQPNQAPAMPTLVAPANGATAVSTNPTLQVDVSDPDGDPLNVTYYGREVTSTPGADFTIVALPDTQFYSSELNGGTAAMFQAQTQWIVNERASRNIVFVTQLGDCVQNGDNGGNPVEWNNADNAISLLENPATTTLADGIPYGIAVGNHDQSPTGNPNGTTTFFNQYFGSARFAGRAYYGGHYGSNNDNHYQLFSAGGLNFITIHFEYDTGADPAVLTWANNLLQTHSNRRAIIASHHIVNTGNPASFGSQGQAIYDALKGNPNLFLMLNGHVAGEGQRQDTFNGNTVYSLLSDYQSRANGGDGWLRIMTFSPANDQIQVETFSPTRNGGAGEFETDANSQFTLSYDMNGGGNNFTVIGTNNSVSGPTTDSMAWSNLENSTKYEWYVTVDDGNITTTSPIWDFDTSSLEADVAGRSTGDGSYLANDPQQVERFLLAADAFDPGKNEYQRADSAPYATQGNGILDAADIQQAENYLVAAVAPQQAGGPTAPNPPAINSKKNSILPDISETLENFGVQKDLLSGVESLFNKDKTTQLLPRVIRVINIDTSPSQQVTVDIQVDAEGDETGYSFTLDYDPTKLSNSMIVNGDVVGAAVTSFDNPQGMQGKRTFSIRFPGLPNGEIPPGNNQVLVRVKFDVNPAAMAGPVQLTFSGTPTANSVTNQQAQTIPANFDGGTVTILGATAASVPVSGRVFSPYGRGVSGAVVQMTDQNGEIRTARTNPFGYYRFESVEIGQSYVFNIFSKQYRVAPQIVEIKEDITDLNFYMQ